MNGNCSTCNIEKQCGYQYKPCDCRDYMKFKAIPPALQDHLAEAIRQHKIAGENARNVYNLTPDQLAYHPVQKPGLTKQQRQIMSGSTTKDVKFVRNPDVAPPVTFRESAGTYWMCKPAYVRETGNHLIPSRGAI
jgi:hypothetical protein